MAAAPDMLEIAVGILQDAHGRVLIAQRRPGTFGAGYWEFPGGKREPGEALEDTLARELREELGIVPRAKRHLIRMHNDLATQRVRLHIWVVSGWHGTVHGREGQRVLWCPEAELSDYDLLPGNRPILNAMRLPDRLAITPEAGVQGRDAWLGMLRSALSRGIRLLRLRAPGLDDSAYADLARQVVVHTRETGTQVLLDRTPEMVRQLGADGLHWPAARAARAGGRPIPRRGWFGVSAHDHVELETAARLDADFAVLSPVRVTTSHPQREPLGWAGWEAVRADWSMPVYALGGLSIHDIDAARRHNAQGVAAIRAFWSVDRQGPRAATVTGPNAK